MEENKNKKGVSMGILPWIIIGFVFANIIGSGWRGESND